MQTGDSESNTDIPGKQINRKVMKQRKCRQGRAVKMEKKDGVKWVVMMVDKKE